MKRTFYIAGVQFRPKNEISQAAKEMKVGDVLRLSPEPENPYDPNAVRIEFDMETTDIHTGGNIFLGYVPKKFSSEVAGMLSIDAPLECIVDAVDPGAKTYEMFKVTVQTMEEENE